MKKLANLIPKNKTHSTKKVVTGVIEGAVVGFVGGLIVGAMGLHPAMVGVVVLVAAILVWVVLTLALR